MKFKKHPNRDKVFVRGAVGNENDFRKAYRKPVAEETQKLADSIYKLAKYFQLSNNGLTHIIKKLGYAIGDHTMEIFLNREYGVGYNPRSKTLKKYKALRKYLREKKKSLEEKNNK